MIPTSTKNKAVSNTKMDDSQSNTWEECLLKLLDPNITPEKALQSLSSPCLSPEVYPKEDQTPVVIFLAYMRFIVRRLPGACVYGIWEQIFRKTVMYSQHCSDSGFEIAIVRVICPKIVPVNALEESEWLFKALTNLRNRQNPYTRLELFRLIRIFKKDWKDIYWSRISVSYINTISNIQPQRLLSNGDVDMTLFGFLDFNYIIDMCFEHGKMVNIISNSRGEVSFGYISKELRFLSHSFKLMGIFATSASLLQDSKTQLFRIKAVCMLFCKIAVKLNSSWKQFRYIFHTICVVQTICDITAAIINNKQRDAKKVKTAKIRDKIVWWLSIHNEPWDLTKLSVHFRQGTLHVCQPRPIQASVLVHQHTLLIKNLHHLYKNSEADNNDENCDYEDSEDEEIDEGEVEEVDEEEIDESIYEEIDDVVSEADSSEFGDSEEGDSFEDDSFVDSSSDE